MTEPHRRRAKLPSIEAWLVAYEIASSQVVTPEQEHTFKALLSRLKDPKEIDSVPDSLTDVRHPQKHLISIDAHAQKEIDHLLLQGRCPLLQQAAGKGHLGLIKLLLEHGANINARYHSFKFVRVTMGLISHVFHSVPHSMTLGSTCEVLNRCLAPSAVLRLHALMLTVNSGVFTSFLVLLPKLYSLTSSDGHTLRMSFRPTRCLQSTR